MANPPGWQTPYPLPQDMAGLPQSGRCKNLGLWLDRYVAYEEKKEGGIDITQDSKKRKNHPGPDNETLTAFAVRQRAILADYRAHGYEVAEFQASPDWRVVIGLGGASVLETGLTTHRVYGFPYLPGSSVKGLARAYAKLVAKAQDTEIAAIFGDTTQAGQVIFFDAIPLKISMELDIMNPHVAEYYQGDSPPADYLSPTPIYFLTIGKQSEFYFALAGRDKELIKKVQEWLYEALVELGAGGKTTAGYGTFNVKGTKTDQTVQASSSAGDSMTELPVTPLKWRRGKVRKFQSSRGELVDEETQEVFRFYQQNIEPKGWSPGLKMTVEYVVVEQGGHPSVLVRKVISYK